MFFNVVFLKISQISQESICVGFLFLSKVAAHKACNFIKKRLQHRCFPLKFAKLLRTPFLTEHLRWLLLILKKFRKVLISIRVP